MMLCSTLVQSGAYLGSSLIPDGVTFPKGYTGTEAVVTLDVCIVPGSPNAELMQPSLKNSIAIWNERRSTSANLRESNLATGLFDFESTALHELGHCIGLGHPNVGFGGGDGNEEFTQSTPGADGIPSFNQGSDGIAGTADDIRGDDINTHYFHKSTNNPFSEPVTIDSSSYSNDVSQLPVGDMFAANASRTASNLARYSTPFTEAAMQQGAFEAEVQRTLSHDDVSTLRYAMSGLDGIQGSADDYRIVLRDGGISSSSDCDIDISMDAAMTSFAACNLVPAYSGGNITIQSSSVFFNQNVNWYYNNSPPCLETTVLPQDTWLMFSSPCQIGISTSAALADVFGDDLPGNRYNIDWVVYEYEYTSDGANGYKGNYKKLEYTDSLRNGVGYWIYNKASSASLSIQGEYSAQIDSVIRVDSSSVKTEGWNLVGQPFRFPVVWADTKVISADGTVMSLSEADPAVEQGDASGVGATSCTKATGPMPSCIMASVGYVYDGAAEVYDEVNLQSGTVAPFSAVWVYAGQQENKIRFTMPVQERVTP